MKKKMRKIRYLTWKSMGRDGWMFFLVLMLSVSLFGLSLMFSYGDDTENALIRNVPMKTGIDNYGNGYATGSQVTEATTMYGVVDLKSEEYLTNLKKYWDQIQTFSNESGASSVNANLSTFFMTEGKDGEYGWGRYQTVFGIDDYSFLTDEKVNITEGEVPTEGSAEGNFIIVSDVFTYNDEKPSIGDTITMWDTKKNSAAGEYVVTGIYHMNYRFDYSFGTEDAFINSNACIVSNSYLWEHLPSIDMMNSVYPTINAVAFSFHDYAKYQTFKDVLTEYQKILGAEQDEFGFHSAEIKIHSASVEGTMNSILRIKTFYKWIFLSVMVLLLVLLYFFIAYLQQGNSREIFIRRAMGSTKKDVISYYVRLYQLPVIPIALLASLLSTVLSWLFSRNMVANNKEMQETLLRYSNNRTMIGTVSSGLSLFDMSGKNILVTLLLVFVFTEAVVSLFAWLSTAGILRQSLAQHAREGN